MIKGNFLFKKFSENVNSKAEWSPHHENHIILRSR